MSSLRNDKGSVLVFMTLMIVLLMIMVGMGLDTGQLTYSRSMGQAAVDASALSAVSALPSRNAGQVQARAAAFNSKNDYIGSPTNTIGSGNVSYVKYDFTTNQITNYSEPIGTANGVRVALEATNAISTPAFLTPLFKLFGASASGTNNVNVSAVSVITARPAIPIALWASVCSGSGIDQIIQMQHPSPQDGVENSCWTTFLDCSSGAPDIKAGFQTAASCSGASINGKIEIGTPICQNRGQVNTVLGAADEFFFTPEHVGRWWLVPVIGGSGNCDPQNPTPVVNWAKIKPTFIDKNGNPKYIKADVVCSPTLPQELDNSLCFSHRLVREPAKGM